MRSGPVLAEITREPLDPWGMLEAVSDAGHGAGLLFVGTVRDYAPGRGEDRSEGRPVSGMTYEAYEPMARTVLTEIATEALERSGGGRIAVAHRTGELTLGEASVVVAVGSPHRAEGYEASRYIIEEIKKRLPVWKREHYTDGTDAWVPGSPLEADR